MLQSRDFASKMSSEQAKRVRELLAGADEDQYRPFTNMAIVQTMRSMLAALIEASMDDVHLFDEHLDSGKIHFKDLQSGEQFLLKSERSRAREMRSKIENTPIEGFDPALTAVPEIVTALFYEFKGGLLTLGRARVEVVRSPGSRAEYFMLEPRTEVGCWDSAHPQESTKGQLPGSPTNSDAFPQDDDDDFDGLGGAALDEAVNSAFDADDDR